MAENDDAFDLIVIGAGPGGYVAAIRGAQLGFKTACVENRDSLGGTCLNVGCIPSKALLHSSELYEQAKSSLGDHGIKATGVEADLPKMLKQKDEVVDGLTQGIESLFKKNKVTWLKGKGTIAEPGKVKVAPAKGRAKTYTAKNILIATGSDVARLPGVEIDENRIVSSTGALSLSKVPKHLVVVGGGYIGLEMGSVWRRLGAKVTVVEFLDSILANMDGETAKQMHRLLAKQGMEFRLGTKVVAAKTSNRGVTLTVAPAKGGDEEEIKCDTVLVAIGRVPYTHGLGLEQAGVEMDDRGRVKTNARFETNVSGIYAIGDVIEGPMLAHKAEDEGIAAAEAMAGQAAHVNYDAIPGVVYTYPEAASVGKTEEQLKESGIDYVAGKFPFTANSRGRTNGETDGFVKILADAKTDRVLGVHIVGPDAGTLIAEVALAMEFGASAEDIARTCHAHPTLNEAVKEAALAVAGRAIHI
ncbi:MAG TPA: dihydrolipoyl dehydrogenase [Alphaproteobacteria bacterium]|nr:dihydrolipoyl dehydrogenase [Alphaproteobacteria bacterium]